MKVDIAAAKIGKYATRESGDTLEMIERPHGGLSLVLVDGQRSGRSAKRISNIACRKAISLLAEGARDGVAARAAHDYLFSVRRGKVRADLQLLSVDLETRTLVLSRNTECPAVLIQKDVITMLNEPAEPIGIYRRTKPIILEHTFEPGVGAIMITDGVLHAGRRFDKPLDLREEVEAIMSQHATAERNPPAQSVADHLLNRALELDNGFARDDISVVALFINQSPGDDEIRRLHVEFPIPAI